MKLYEILRGVTNKTIVKNLIWVTNSKKKSTLDCEIKILSKLFLNQQEDVWETFEI